jgi:hypothetical protein
MEEKLDFSFGSRNERKPGRCAHSRHFANLNQSFQAMTVVETVYIQQNLSLLPDDIQQKPSKSKSNSEVLRQTLATAYRSTSSLPGKTSQSSQTPKEVILHNLSSVLSFCFFFFQHDVAMRLTLFHIKRLPSFEVPISRTAHYLLIQVDVLSTQAISRKTIIFGQSRRLIREPNTLSRQPSISFGLVCISWGLRFRCDSLPYHKNVIFIF